MDADNVFELSEEIRFEDVNVNGAGHRLQQDQSRLFHCECGEKKNIILNDQKMHVCKNLLYG